jgi:hypothetical protein
LKILGQNFVTKKNPQHIINTFLFKLPCLNLHLLCNPKTKEKQITAELGQYLKAFAVFIAMKT